MVPEGSRGQGFKGSSEMLKNYTCHGVADKRSRKELNVWKKSYELCLKIYRITAKFPNEERYGLIFFRQDEHDNQDIKFAQR